MQLCNVKKNKSKNNSDACLQLSSSLLCNPMQLISNAKFLLFVVAVVVVVVSCFCKWFQLNAFAELSRIIHFERISSSSRDKTWHNERQ